MNLNEHFLRLSDTDYASVIDKKVSDFQFINPDTVIVRLDGEDAQLSYPDCVSRAMVEATEELKNDLSLRKIPPHAGYPFLINSIKEYYAQRNIQLFESEIFVSNGAKSDIAGILDLASSDNTVLITEPFNPLYYSTNLCAGRVVRFVSAKEDQSPRPDEEHADIIYLCSPSNPTGKVLSFSALEKWVDYALYHNALILFDASYEAFVHENGLPRSIYEIEGARKCAVEICTLSKSAGFANTRLGYTVIPNSVIFDSVRFNQLWSRRTRLKFNGVSYIVQKGAQAALSKEGQAQIQKQVDYYLDNIFLLTKVLSQAGLCADTPPNAPHLWFRCPKSMSSWECFDYLLEKAGVAAIPGSIFGSQGENHIKITGYNSRENILIAAARLKTLFASDRKDG